MVTKTCVVTRMQVTPDSREAGTLHTTNRTTTLTCSEATIQHASRNSACLLTDYLLEHYRAIAMYALLSCCTDSNAYTLITKSAHMASGLGRGELRHRLGALHR